MVHRRAQLIADGGVDLPDLELRSRPRRQSLEELRHPPRRRLDCDRRLQGARRQSLPGIGLGNEVFPALDFLIASQPQGAGRRASRPATPRHGSTRKRQARRRGRRRRYGHGLRAHRGAPGRASSVQAASTAATAPTCRAPMQRGRATPRRRAWSSSGSPQPEAVLGDGKVEAMRALQGASRRAPMRPRAARRRRSIPGSSFTMEADMVIKALGFDPEPILPAAVRRAGCCRSDALGHDAWSISAP